MNIDNDALVSDTAEAMARVALKRATERFLEDTRQFQTVATAEVFGVGCTAALVSATPKKGSHRCNIAIISSLKGLSLYRLTLNKALGRSREEEDSICSALVLDSIARHCAVEAAPVLSGGDHPIDPATIQSVPLSSIRGTDTANHDRDEILKSEDVPADSIAAVCERRLTHSIFILKHDESSPASFAVLDGIQLPFGSVVYPGSFNPLHEGHIALVSAAIESIQPLSSSSPPPLVVFEIAVANADKPSLEREEVRRRLLQFDTARNSLLTRYNLTNIAVVITSEPMFVGKSSLFKGCTFLIGADTCARLIDSKYYRSKTPTNGEPAPLPPPAAVQEKQAVINTIAALLAIKNNECRFLVGGRAASSSGEGQPSFDTMESIFARSEIYPFLPKEVVSIFQGLEESQFRVDISSSELRQLRA